MLSAAAGRLLGVKGDDILNGTGIGESSGDTILGGLGVNVLLEITGYAYAAGYPSLAPNGFVQGCLSVGSTRPQRW